LPHGKTGVGQELATLLQRRESAKPGGENAQRYSDILTHISRAFSGWVV